MVCRARRLTRLRRARKKRTSSSRLLQPPSHVCVRRVLAVNSIFPQSLTPSGKKIIFKILLRSDAVQTAKLERSVAVLNRRRFLKRPNATRLSGVRLIGGVRRVEHGKTFSSGKKVLKKKPTVILKSIVNRSSYFIRFNNSA